jgi:hypothetical protein
MEEHQQSIDTFKNELSRFIAKNPLCMRNNDFPKNLIPKECIIMEVYTVNLDANVKRLHYWWMICGKIYDPTIHQFGKNTKNLCIDPDLRSLLQPDEQFHFDAIILAFSKLGVNPVYDEAECTPEVNLVLQALYKRFEDAKLKRPC